jgi:hypothetical protein
MNTGTNKQIKTSTVQEKHPNKKQSVTLRSTSSEE